MHRLIIHNKIYNNQGKQTRLFFS